MSKQSIDVAHIQHNIYMKRRGESVDIQQLNIEQLKLRPVNLSIYILNWRKATQAQSTRILFSVDDNK